MKLGYSERLVQLALGRLGNPTNNELLAELIKLGAQPGYQGNGALRTRFLFFFFESLFVTFIFLCFNVWHVSIFFSCSLFSACDFGADIKNTEINDDATSDHEVLRPIIIDGKFYFKIK